MIPELNSREQQLLQYITAGKTYSIKELSEKFHVSQTTIRSDYKSLEEHGLVITIKGGVLPAFYPSIITRLQEHVDTKERIAKKAAELILEDDNIMLSSGTSCALLGRYLYGIRGLNVITNSTLLLRYAASNPNLSIHLLGGDFFPPDAALLGEYTVREIKKFFPRMAIVGSDYFSLESGLTSRNPESAAVVRQMLLQSPYKVLMVESRKFGQARFVKILPIDVIDVIVTDNGLQPDIVQELEARNIRVMLV